MLIRWEIILSQNILKWQYICLLHGGILLQNYSNIFGRKTFSVGSSSAGLTGTFELRILRHFIPFADM